MRLPKIEELQRSIHRLAGLPAIVVAPICPPSPEGPRYQHWDWRQLGAVVREISDQYRVDAKKRSVIGFSMGGSGAWKLPSYEPELFTKVVVIAGVCHGSDDAELAGAGGRPAIQRRAVNRTSPSVRRPDGLVPRLWG